MLGKGGRRIAPADGLAHVGAVTVANDVTARTLQKSDAARGWPWVRGKSMDTFLPLGPGLGWQDLRTVGRCLELRAEGLHLAPNTTATKAEWLLDQLDPAERREALVGTIDAWLVWSLTEGAVHAGDATNADVTGLFADGGWMMYPLVLCSLLALGVIIAKAWTLWVAHSKTKQVTAAVEEAARAGRIDEAIGLASDTPGPAAAILLAGLRRIRRENKRIK